ncbi:DHA2 family efflux MFS transporter permease subunit [Streptococcus lutetiensis]|uniref:DHA2 family efflux MFS transporter permease subunit n=1 Tax=Streptococcus lutetiensis TaxID=150055 RepID=UPI0018A8C3C9|nr:DHA2 family efflux MFS transporter permease subunit [Streptococcus lutetiensis]
MSEEKISAKVIRAIVGAGMLSFCGVVVETAMNITFPTLMKEFNINTSTVQWMTTIYLLVVASVVPLSAYLKRSFKTKSVFLAANLLFILGVLIDAIAPSFALLLVGRVIQGIGVGIALPLMFNIILDQVPMSKIGTMMGVGTLITAVAPAIGPTFGGFVSSHFGWRFVFILLTPLLLISLILGVTSIEQKNKVARESLDLISVIAILCLFVGLILGINNLAEYDFFSVPVLGGLVVGIAGLLVLVKRSSHLEQPIVNLSILKNGKFAGHVIAFFLFQIVNLGMSFIIPNYIQLVNHSSSIVAGLLVFPGAIIGACFAPFSGRILDRLGAKKPIIFGVSLLAFALYLFSILALHLPNTWLTVIYILSMAGTGIAFGNIMTNGQKQVTSDKRADANAIFNTLQQFAGAVGTTVASLVVALSQSNTSISYSEATARGSRNAFIILLVLAVIELIILFRVVDGKEKEA